MDISTTVNIILCVLSFMLAAISVVIVVLTLKQNSKMIESSTRPYVSVYLGDTYFSSLHTYLVIKNFGTSAATITDFRCNIDLQKYSFDPDKIPFKHIIGTQLCPNQSLKCPINASVAPKDLDMMTINIEYESHSQQRYKETYRLNFSAYFDVVHVRANTKDSHLKEVSFALQDIAEKML